MKSICFGKRLTEVRKDKKMSQDDVGKLVGVHGAVIGRYERDEVKPSIEMATQLAEALEVSLDYLVGSTDVLLEKSIVNRVLDIQKLKENDKQHVFALLDAFIKQTKFQSIMYKSKPPFGGFDLYILLFSTLLQSFQNIFSWKAF